MPALSYGYRLSTSAPLGATSLPATPVSEFLPRMQGKLGERGEREHEGRSAMSHDSEMQGKVRKGEEFVS